MAAMYITKDGLKGVMKHLGNTIAMQISAAYADEHERERALHFRALGMIDALELLGVLTAEQAEDILDEMVDPSVFD